jgi:hypothetical protein
MKVVRFVTTAVPCRCRRVRGRHGSTIVLYPRASEVRLEYLVQVVTIQKQAETSTVGTKLARSHRNARGIQGTPIVDIVVAPIKVGRSVILRHETRTIGNRHSRTKTSTVGIVRPAAVGSSITRSMHGTVRVKANLIRGRLVVPSDSQLLAQVIVKISEGRRGIGFKLKLHVSE